MKLAFDDFQASDYGEVCRRYQLHCEHSDDSLTEALDSESHRFKLLSSHAEKRQLAFEFLVGLAALARTQVNFTI